MPGLPGGSEVVQAPILSVRCFPYSVLFFWFLCFASFPSVLIWAAVPRNGRGRLGRRRLKGPSGLPGRMPQGGSLYVGSGVAR